MGACGRWWGGLDCQGRKKGGFRKIFRMLQEGAPRGRGRELRLPENFPEVQGDPAGVGETIIVKILTNLTAGAPAGAGESLSGG